MYGGGPPRGGGYAHCILQLRLYHCLRSLGIAVAFEAAVVATNHTETLCLAQNLTSALSISSTWSAQLQYAI
jgi:hypothetical protein